MATPITLYIVRHGATVMNNDTDVSEDRIRAWLNVPLAPEGRIEAHQAAMDLRPYDIQHVFSSDLARAHETALIICADLAITCEVNSKLRPWNLGHFAGQSTKDAMPEIAKYVCDYPNTAVPGGESFHQFKERAIRGLFECATAANGRNVALVTHHRDERLFFSLKQPIIFDPKQSLNLKAFLDRGEPPGAVQLIEVSLDKNPGLSPQGAPLIGRSAQTLFSNPKRYEA